MSNSPLVTYVKLSPNCTKPRQKKIRKIVIHHMAGNLSVETCGDVFAPSSRQASSNYGVDSNGKVGMYVEEKNRSWCTSNRDIDHEAITIEVANSKVGGNWPVSSKAMKKLIELCADICKRNDIEEIVYTGDKSGNLHMHCWYANTNCPGPYLKSKFPYIAKQVNKKLKATTAKKKADKTKDALATGSKLKLNKVSLYASSDAKTKAATKSGVFYVWNKQVINNRVRITNSKLNVGKAGKVTGWIDYSVAKKSKG